MPSVPNDGLKSFEGYISTVPLSLRSLFSINITNNKSLLLAPISYFSIIIRNDKLILQEANKVCQQAAAIKPPSLFSPTSNITQDSDMSLTSTMFTMDVILILILSTITFICAIDVTENPSLDASLFTAATQLDRLKQLPSDSDWVFDFTTEPSYTYSPGSVVNANAATFPAIVGNGMTLAMLNLGPCAMLPPHYHPRATNLVVAVAGTTNTYMIEENGARMVSETLTPGKMTIFPRASLHSMQNMGEPPHHSLLLLNILISAPGCGNATLVSALNSEDAGTHNIMNALYSLPFDIMLAAYGNPAPSSAAYDFFRAYNISDVPPVGTGSIIGSADCLAACQKSGIHTGS